MIVVTGGACFIGSYIVWRLNTSNRDDIIIVDSLGTDEKWKNLVGLNFIDFIHKDDFVKLLESSSMKIDAIIHMGANSSTTEKDADSLLRDNFEYTKKLAEYCLRNNLRFIYASSAATYGDGSLGFDDSESGIYHLRPLNMYGYSKAMFDLWAVKKGMLSKIVGLKYFNVFGPNEYHKGDMRSVVHKAFEQISQTGKVRLFKSAKHKNKNGLYNVGTGKARTWNDLVAALFKAISKPLNIEYIELPSHLLDKCQYYTEAKIDKILREGYSKPLTSL